MMKRMTHCERCNEETKNEEWREHIISGKHLARESRKHCKICKMS